MKKNYESPALYQIVLLSNEDLLTSTIEGDPDFGFEDGGDI